ncbi:MAG: hypothetical protein NT159_05830 [Proteobacteria bacterium]|nr:hypothetical protein [Pseudomonadota bacterium]
MARGGLTRIGNLINEFNRTYDTVGRVMTDSGLKRIADAQQDQSTAITEKNAPNPDDYTYDEDTGQYVPSLRAVQAGQGDLAPVLPAFDSKTTTSFLGKAYDQPLTDNEQTAIKTNAAADLLSRRDPAAATRLRIAGIEAKRLIQDDTDQQSIRAAWGAPDNTQPVRGLQRIDPVPATASNAHGTLATPDEANAELASLGTGASGLAPRSVQAAPAQPMGGSINPDEAAAAEAKLRNMGGSINPDEAGSPQVSPGTPGTSLGPIQAANADLALRKAGGREAANTYIQRKAPQVIDAYLKAGKIDEAKRLRDFVDSEDGRAYTQEWSHGVRALAVGDYLGAIDTFQRMYNSQRAPDGNTVKLTPSSGGLSYTAEIYGPDGQMINSVTKPTGDIAKYAGMALSPERMAEFMAKNQAAKEHDVTLLDRQVQLEGLRQQGQQTREDRRDDRLDTRLDAQSEMLDRRLSTSGGLTQAQQRGNAEIDAARAAVSGMTPSEILRRSQKATNTGRENPDYDPSIARAANLSGRRKIGADDQFDSRAGGQSSPQAAQTSAQSRFTQDPAMQGMRLGRQTANGVEVFDQNGRHVGYYR